MTNPKYPYSLSPGPVCQSSKYLWNYIYMTGLVNISRHEFNREHSVFNERFGLFRLQSFFQGS